MITLYQYPNSVCCQKVRLALREKKLSWDVVNVDLTRNEQYTPAYLALNPTGVVPTVVDGGNVVTESSLICEYIDETRLDPPLLPRSALGRTRVRRWMKLVDEGLHEGVGEITFSARRDRLANMTPAERNQFFDNVGDPRRRDRFRSTFEHGADSPFVLHAVAAFKRAFGQLEATLRHGEPWIEGDQFTLAEVALAPYVARLHYLGLLELWLGDLPSVRAWWDRVQQRPSCVAEIRDSMEPEVAKMADAGAPLKPKIGALIAALPG